MSTAGAPQPGTGRPWTPVRTETPGPATTITTSQVVGPSLPASVPVRLGIPALHVDTALGRLGLDADGSVQVPDLDDPHATPGWFDGSPTPGEPGPAVILGHVDSRAFGPEAFYAIGSLRPGDTVDVTRADGTVAVFRVDGVRSYPKDDFPTLTVYGNIDRAGLRLISCGGTFDRATGHYQSNIVVFATLAASHPAP